VLQIVVQIPSVRRLGYSISPGFDFRSSEFRTIVRRWLPVVSTSAVFTVNQQIALYFASGLADGSGSAMTNALTFWQLPFGIFSASVTTVLFPRMSREAAANDLEGFGKTVSGGITSLVLLLVPSGIGLLFLGHGIVSVALQRGAFLAVHTDLTARVLGAYGIGLFSVGAFTFLQRAYYSLGDYRTPLITAACTVIVDVVFSLFLKETYLGVTGLAWANTIAFTVGLVVFAVTLRARTRLIFTTKNLIRSGIAAIVGSGAGAFVVLGGSYGLTIFGMGNWWQSESFPVRATILTVFLSASLFGVIFVYRLFGYTVRGIMQRNKS